MTLLVFYYGIKMSPNKSKQMGNRWEHDLVEILSRQIKNSSVRRIPGSGALGTSLGESLLTADIKATFEGLNKPFKIEAKSGYGGSKQLTIKKEWLNKVKKEAELDYSYPALACKFLGARSADGVQYFIVLD